MASAIRVYDYEDLNAALRDASSVGVPPRDPRIRESGKDRQGHVVRI
jgi:hypothetical protein